MEEIMNIGYNINKEYMAICIIVIAILTAIILIKFIDLELDNIWFYIWEVVIAGLIFAVVWLICYLSISDRHEYVRVAETEIMNDIEYTGKNSATGNYNLTYKNSEGQLIDINEPNFICVDGPSKIISYYTYAKCWLYEHTQVEHLIVLDYNTYFKVVGDTNELLKSSNIIKVIHSEKLNVLGNKIENTQSNTVDNENKDNSDSMIISDLQAKISQKDNLIQEYTDKITQLEKSLEEKDSELAKKVSELDNTKNKIAKLQNKKEFTSIDFVNVCIGIGIIILVGMGVFLMILYTKHKFTKLEMTLKSELKIREGVMLDKDIK